MSSNAGPNSCVRVHDSLHGLWRKSRLDTICNTPAAIDSCYSRFTCGIRLIYSLKCLHLFWGKGKTGIRKSELTPLTAKLPNKAKAIDRSLNLKATLQHFTFRASRYYTIITGLSASSFPEMSESLSVSSSILAGIAPHRRHLGPRYAQSDRYRDSDASYLARER
jgi:hypothetical protein